MNVAWHDPVADTMNRAPLVMNNLNTTYRANLIGFNLCFCRQFWLDDKDRSFSDAAIGLFYHQVTQ